MLKFSAFEKKSLGADKDGIDLFELLSAWRGMNFLREIDFAFAKFLWMEVPQASALSILSAALASYQLGRGHVCLDLEYFLEEPDKVLDFPLETARFYKYTPADVFEKYDADAFIKELSPEIFEKGAGNAPLVCDGKRIYLRRYWECEQTVVSGLTSRLAGKNNLSDEELKLMRENLSVLFKERENDVNWQKAACAVSVHNAVSIITGGPGTGKTTTVFRLLALLQSLALSKEGAKPLNIRLAAPTGKAAARLSASIAAAKESIGNDFHNAELIREAIPSNVSTLHRLLGMLRNSRRFRHNADNKLPVDLLVIDEASMVDLEMMASVLDALPENARLILIGDKDQLASVEAGAVLGELCQSAESGRYTDETVKALEKSADISIPENLRDKNGSLINQATTMLRKNYRFADELGIAKLARAVNAGDVDAVFGLMEETLPDVAFLKTANTDESIFVKTVIDGYGRYLRVMREGCAKLDKNKSKQEEYDKWARAVLEARESFQILCVVREDAFGVDGINEKVRRILLKDKLILENAEWYLGRPVIVTKNSYDLGLMNGDMGVTLRDASGELRVAFLLDEERVKWASPSRLQSLCESVYALTVHKSQGSEFSHVVLVLPEQINPVMTRELLYTGVTRAREKFTLVYSGDKELLRQAITTCVHRMSGLSEAIKSYSSSK